MQQHARREPTGRGSPSLTHHGDEALTYDAAGRVIQDGSRTLEWDAKGRLARVTRGDVVEEYTYAHDDTRAVKTTFRGVTAETVRYIAEDAEERAGHVVRYVLLDGARIARLDAIDSASTPSAAPGHGEDALRTWRELPRTLAALLALVSAALSLGRRLRSLGRGWPRPGIAIALLVAGAVSCRGSDDARPSLRSQSRLIEKLPASAVFYLGDSQDTPLALVDATGGQVSEATLHPYGAPRTGGHDDPFSYVGNEIDRSVGLSDFRARPYRPELGIFLAPDPVSLFSAEKFLEQPIRLGSYLYAAADPINLLDPNGTEPTSRLGALKQRIGEWKQRFDKGLIYGDYAGSYLAQTAKGDRHLRAAQQVATAVATVAAGEVAAAGAVVAGGRLAVWAARGRSLPSGARKAASIATPHGTATQQATPVAQAALREARSGAPLYRQGAFGVQETTGAQFWSLSNPASTAGYAAKLGMPGGAAPKVDWIMGGTLRAGAPAVTRNAPGVGTNAGGAVELVVKPGGVTGLWFHMP